MCVCVGCARSTGMSIISYVCAHFRNGFLFCVHNMPVSAAPSKKRTSDTSIDGHRFASSRMKADEIIALGHK